MEKFTIQIDMNGKGNGPHFQMEPSNWVLKVAKDMSIANPGKTVDVTMFARTRWQVKDGEVIWDMPDLSHFYANPSEADKWDWSCHGEAK